MNENENLNNNTTDDVCDSIPEGAKDVNLNEENLAFHLYQIHQLEQLSLL